MLHASRPFKGQVYMYESIAGGGLNPAFAEGMEEFQNFAYTHLGVQPNMTILCPCDKCTNCSGVIQ